VEWTASWIWHPAPTPPDNFYLHARRTFHLAAPAPQAVLRVTAGSLYQLFINGVAVARGPNPSDPSRYYYDEWPVGERLVAGDNQLAVLAYHYGPQTRGILGQNWGPGGLLLELAQAPDGAILVASDTDWRVLRSPIWDPLAPVNCTLLGDFKETQDTRCEPLGWRDMDFDDSAWLAPAVLGRPPLAPYTTLVPREIPALGGQRVWPVNAFWESASVTYAWRDDWEVYRETNLVPGHPHADPTRPCRVQRTHHDFTPAVLLDFGRLVTGYPEITVADSQGGAIDVLYGESLWLTRVDRFVLRGGAQVLQPFGRRTFRYLKLLFPDTPAPIELADVSLELNTYPVQSAGDFACSDPLLDRIWSVGRYTQRLSMLDHFVDCPWRERTIYGGDIYAENLIAWYAFGDGRLCAKTLRQMFALQHDDGAVPPYGPYRGCDSFYPAWSAFTGLALLDHWLLSGDRDLLDELWPALTRLLAWTLGQLAIEDRALIGEPAESLLHDAWMAAPKTRFGAGTNLAFLVLLRRAAALGAARGDVRAASWHAAAAAMTRAVEDKLLEPAAASEADGGSVLWSGLLDEARGADLARRLLSRQAAPLGCPFQALFLVEGLYEAGRPREALDYLRAYWGEMLARGATTFWEHFSLAWPPGVEPDRGVSRCHGWSAGPTYTLPARVLGVRPLTPGFGELLVAPQPGDLTWARGIVPTPHGPVAVSWRLESDSFVLDLDLPAPCVARVSLPDPRCDEHRRFTVTAGSHHLAVPDAP
jgi:hypothetical protein